MMVFHSAICVESLLLRSSTFIGPPPPPLNPVYHVQSFNQHNVTIIVQWGYEHRRDAHNYTIAGTHFLTTSTETNETTITLPYNESQTINVTANNCIGSSNAASVTFFERKLLCCHGMDSE